VDQNYEKRDVHSGIDAFRVFACMPSVLILATRAEKIQVLTPARSAGMAGRRLFVAGFDGGESKGHCPNARSRFQFPLGVHYVPSFVVATRAKATTRGLVIPPQFYLASGCACLRSYVGVELI